jgi:hypothetical protein
MSFPLSPVRRGEGRGEGRLSIGNASAAIGEAPHPDAPNFSALPKGLRHSPRSEGAGSKRRSRRAPRSAGLPGGVPPPPRPERSVGLLLPLPPPRAAGRVGRADCSLRKQGARVLLQRQSKPAASRAPAPPPPPSSAG